MREKGKTSIHLLLASIVTMFGVMLILITIAMSWEPWMVPVILIGNTLVWCLHIGRIGSETFYENLCAGLLMVGFFFFGVHKVTLFDIPAVACMLVLVFSMFNKKRLLYMTAALYVLVLLYQFLLLHTITRAMGPQEMVRLGFGITVVIGSMAIAIYRINRRRETKKEHDATLALLEESGKQNAEFLSNVSHELRTPINMVIGISEVLLEKDISAEIRNDMESIKLAGKRLSNQINNMIDYTEIVEGTLTPAKEPYMITSLLNDIITMTAMQGGKHQLEIVFDLDPLTPAVLIGDVEKIAHVIKILLDNSIKFTDEGGIDVCIKFRRESYGVNLIIDISDTGIGMTDMQITQMCDDFYQADSGSNRLSGGLGLGLPIARGLLHAMGGFLHFDSKEQQGLHAQITIPQGVEDDSPAMVLADPERLCIACYFRPEKYNSDEVRRYYDNMILHMMEGLGIRGYQAHNFQGLQKLQNSHPLTHVFIAQAEYEENRSYYEDLAATLPVVVIAERDFMQNRDSRLLVIRKPFFALSVVNLLNGEMDANGFKEAQAAGRKPFSCEGVRVLAVDDEEMNLVVAKGVLGSYGIQVDTCLSGKEAVERCSETPYDIVFLDHMMPGFDGVETLKQIREINNGMYQDLPVVALTANTISGAREMFRSEGFTEFIPKPIERAVLERVLRKILPEQNVQYAETPEIDGEDMESIDAADLRDSVGSPETMKKPEEAEKRETEADAPAAPKRKRKRRKNNSPANAEEKKKEDLDAPAERVPEKAAAEERVSEPAVPEDNLPADVPREPAAQEEMLPEDVIPEDAILEDVVSEEYPSDHLTEEDDFSETRSAYSYEPLVRIGINIQLGLDYCCGEDSFYLEMLKMFCSQAVEKKAEIESLYETANWKDYTVKVHALKSTSMTIGAERLADEAKLLEQAGKDHNIEYIRHGHPILLRLYDEVCETIAGL